MKVRAQISMVLNPDLASAALREPLPPRPSPPDGEEGVKSAMHLSARSMA
jgi:hypothetical protein